MCRDTRAEALEESLTKLGVERLNKDDVQKMQWDVLEPKIGNWVHYMRIAVRRMNVLFHFYLLLTFFNVIFVFLFGKVKLLFTGEKKICDQILEGVESLRSQCFAEITANSLAMLLSFGEAVAKSKRSPEKLFVLLDMYEIMKELQPEVCFVYIYRQQFN